MRIAAYVYPGWHPIPERDASFHPGFTEWELVEDCKPRYPGHPQPRVPLLGTYDDRDPLEVGRRPSDRSRVLRKQIIERMDRKTLRSCIRQAIQVGAGLGSSGAPPYLR